MSDVRRKTEAARTASKRLATAPAEEKNTALETIARTLREEQDSILECNSEDLRKGEEAGISPALADRLKLTETRLEEMARGLEELTRLPDPVGEVMERTERENGLRIEKVRVPLGVIGMIYEARPNVTVDAAGLALKTGNAVVLRGSSSAYRSNARLVEIIRKSLALTPLPRDAVQLVEDPDREAVREMLHSNGRIDVIIPRGGAGLIQRVVRESTVPVLETGVGNCHIYVDRSADPEMAGRIVLNGKTDRPAVCNAVETLLIHREWADHHLHELGEALLTAGVEIRGCPRTRDRFSRAVPAHDTDWEKEYLDRILAVRVVDSLNEAMEHIDRYGTRHSEAIVTEDAEAARRFLQEVDAAAVYHNASTRFTDGSQFGFGAEIGISTQKLHARGPMGLKELTSCKYRVLGSGQVR
ncbi:glutamate-5-semialdehyde dehydrogenase [Melghirimyces profundicolus]|uniref:Gamma-glutamyl phosphate reductase n=1 Tax=Melghirimyces profundicolus TaxID=1242148 RepID=A0A2T6C8A4_9BACL|nr:glutamate-5-semialdehyde dehydrogenase [Melghirimyces profundicolus]PTX64550.1 glutamate-5-semialdehyde dehydrogenase [Melghirimyces profundicolus]